MKLFFYMLFSISILHATSATKVFVTKVSQKPYVDVVEALGTLRANEHVALAPTVTEAITAIHFDDNQRVKKGDLLVELDAREEFAELAEEESKLSEATRQVQRLEPLAAKGAASKMLLDENRLEVQTAKARINAIKARIDLRRIKAPFDGIVGLRNISVGSLVKSDSLITTVDDDSVMKLDFTVPSLYLKALKIGLTVEAQSRAFGLKSFKGVISAIDSKIDPITRSITVRAKIKNKNRLLKPGLLMQVNIEVNPRKALIIPEQAILSDSDRNLVLVVVDTPKMKTVKRQYIKIGSRKKGFVEVVDGLSEGDKIVTHGLMRAKVGKPVIVSAIQNDDESLNELLSKKSNQ